MKAVAKVQKQLCYLWKLLLNCPHETLFQINKKLKFRSNAKFNSRKFQIAWSSAKTYSAKSQLIGDFFKPRNFLPVKFFDNE